MFMLLYLLLVVISTVFNLHSVYAQDLPPISCPKYFKYLSENGEIIGKITLFNLPKDTVNVDLRLTQRVQLDGNYVGNISLFKDLRTTEQNLLNGKPISYRVIFPNTEEVPKLARISVNGHEICFSDQYPKPSENFVLMHFFYPTFSTTKRRPGPLPSEETVKYRQGGRDDIEYTPLDQNQLASIESNFPAAYANCGRAVNSSTPLIYGGTVSQRGQFPWLTAIYRKHPSGLQLICGGSLISTRSVITAAHCCKIFNLKASDILVFLGRYNLEDYSEDGWVTRELQSMRTHPDYRAKQYSDADLSILHLKTPVSFTQYIQPICLWSESADQNLIVGKTGIVAGWGADQSGNALSALPKMVDTNIVSEAQCLRSVEAFRTLTTSRTFCAGKRDDTGPCQGDSGGGLIIERHGSWVLRGIVSAGQTTQLHCNLRQYVLYCDVAQHIQWVRRNMLT